jgi:RNA polymerase sigma-70 factor (ECF subfamily)
MSTVATPSGTMESPSTEFEKLFREHSPLVYQTACGVTGSPADAEDVVQTIFLRLLRRRLPADFCKRPERYLYRAAINVSLNTIRSRRRQVLIGDSQFFDSPESAENPKVEDPDTVQLRAAISKLSPRTVEILILRYVHDYTEPEIAKLLGRSRSTIAVTLFRSRLRLRKLIRRASSSGERK